MFEVIFSFVIGAIFGSFGNVFIHRWPQGGSVRSPARSQCPQCQTQLKWYDNIPLFSFMWLRGKCRSCGWLIPKRYFIVEALTGFLFALVWIYYGTTITTVELWMFCFGLVVVSFIDLKHFLLPDLFTLSGIGIGLVGAYINPDRSFLDAALGVLIGGGFLWAIAYFYFVFRKQEGLGGGDIKLLAWIGAVLGWKAIPFVILVASLVGTVLGLVLAGSQRKGMQTMIPFGPYLALGALIYVFGGQVLANSYVQLFLPALAP